MVSPGLVYLVLCLALVAIAIVVHVSSVNLSLPIAPGLSFITILLPVFGAINALYYPRLLYAAQHTRARVERLLPNVLQILQAVLTTVLATLFLQEAIPGTILDCGLSSQWLKMWRGKHGDKIKRIQDILDCCGFNSVRDMAWPFPSGSGNNHVQCATRYGRTNSCAGLLKEATQRNSGMDLGVVLGVGLLQIITLLLMRGANNWRNSWWAQGWRRVAGGEGDARERSARTRPLLQAPESDDDGEEPVTYKTITSSPSHPGVQGSNGNGPRVEPSFERNAWNGD